MSDRKYEYVFGPVPSRRLGRSLGVDLVPHKTCTFDCIYCQVGLTTCKTIERATFVPREAVAAEVASKLAEGAEPDYVTMSGSGEPTLYKELGWLIRWIKENTGAKVAVLTNGSLLYRDDVRNDLLEADLIVPSLDAGTATTYQQVNRPHPDISFDLLLEGLVSLREDFAKQIWLEVFLVGNLPDVEAEARTIARHALRIRPDRVQLNTVVRPPADSNAKPVSREDLERMAGFFEPRAEVVVPYARPSAGSAASVTAEGIVAMLRRRPCSVDDIASGLGVHAREVEKHLGSLQAKGQVHSEVRNGTRFFAAGPDDAGT